MLLRKSTHERIIQSLRDDNERVLATERAHFAEAKRLLEDQIADLRRLVFVPAPSHIETLPVRTANAILDGVEVMPQEDPTLEADMREANRIFSGDYSNVEESW